MEVLITYDVNTETSAGRKRLRKVATICSGFGQRVQNSVFECQVTAAQLEMLEQRLVDTIDRSIGRSFADLSIAIRPGQIHQNLLGRFGI